MTMGEDATFQRNVSRKMSLVIGARRHLECGHEKYIMDTIQSHPAQVMLLSTITLFDYILWKWISLTIFFVFCLIAAVFPLNS